MKGLTYRIMTRLLDIREGEHRPAALLHVCFFLVITTFMLLRPTVNSLFLSEFGVEQLPYAFILLAVVTAAVTIYYSRFLSHVALIRVIRFTNSSGILLLLFFGAMLAFNIAVPVMIYALYIWLSIYVALASSQFWLLTNIVFSVREAKRLFGFIGAGAITGGILGGYLASLLANLIHSENIVFVAALFIAAVIPASGQVWRKDVESKLSDFLVTKRYKGPAANPFSIVRKSKYLLLVSGIVGVGVVVSKLVDYQFSAFVTSTITDQDELTAFFGFWYSTFNVISLVVQLFLTRKIVGMYGVGTSLLVHPAAIGAGAVILLFFPILWAAIFLQMSDASLKNSLNRSAVEMLSLPIPLEVKTRVKSFIDVFVDRCAMGLAGLLIIFVLKGLQLPLPFINILTLLVIGVWIYLVVLIRREYLETIRSKLRQQSEGKAKPGFDLASTSVLGGIIRVFQTGKDKQILYLLDKVFELKDNRLFDVIRSLLSHPNGQVRAAALKNLYLYSSPNISEQIHGMISDPEPEVRIRAMEYLIVHAPENRVALISSLVEHEDPRINGAALVSLAIQSRNNPEMRNLLKTGQRIREKVDNLDLIEDKEMKNRYTTSILQAIGHAGLPALYPFIRKYLNDQDHELASRAIHAAGHTLSPEFIGILQECLVDRNLSEAAANALAGYGKDIIPYMQKHISQQDIHVDYLRKAPSVAGKIGSQDAVDFLFSLLEYEDVPVRNEVMKSLTLLKTNYPFLQVNLKKVVMILMEEAAVYMETIQILLAQIAASDTTGAKGGHGKPQENPAGDARKSLVKILEGRLEGTLERIFRLLGLKYPSEEILQIYEGIREKNTEVKSAAMEYLESLLELNLKKIIMPVVEMAFLEIGERTLSGVKIRLPSDIECFEKLLRGKDTRVKLAVLYLIEQLGDKKFSPLVEKQFTDNHEKVRRFAQRTASRILGQN